MLCHRDLEVVSRPGTIIKKSVDRAINDDEVDHFVGLDQFPGACVVSFSFFSRLSPRNNLSDKWVRSVPWSQDQGGKNGTMAVTSHVQYLTKYIRTEQRKMAYTHRKCGSLHRKKASRPCNPRQSLVFFFVFFSIGVHNGNGNAPPIFRHRQWKGHSGTLEI